MERLSEKYTSQVSRIKDCVEDSYTYNRENIERFKNLKAFVHKSSLFKKDKDALQSDEKPVMELNVVEAYVSRLRGEFSKQVPEIDVRPQSKNVSWEQVDVVQGHVRSIFCSSEYEHKIANPVYNDTLSGGFSVIKVYTEYEHEDSMKQVIKLEKVFEPELCGFDPLARESSKADGNFCFQLVPKYGHELEAEYPDIDFSQIKKSPLVDGNFRWSYNDISTKRDIYYIADYYEKKYEYETMYLVSDPMNPDAEHSMWKSEYDEMIANWQSIAEPPQILKRTKRRKTKIIRYKFVEDTLLEKPEETTFDYLPIVFVDGNSVTIEGQQTTRPYIYNAVDAQRIKNLTASAMVNDIISMRQTDVLIANEALPFQPEFIEAWKDPGKTKAALVYQHIGDDGSPNPAPQIFPRSQINPAYAQINQLQDQTLQHILGSYDASLGINQNQLSGVAIVEGATQSNNAAMPYVINYLSALNQVANIIVSLMPKYYNTLRTIPIVTEDGKREYVTINDSRADKPVMMNYSTNDMLVSLRAGANFDVQKNKSLQTIIELMKISENFRGMIEQKGLPVLLDNVDIKGGQQLKQMSEEYMQEMEQKAAQQQNPQQQMLQAQMQVEQEKLQLEQQKLQLQARKQQGDFMIQIGKLKQESEKMAEEAMMMRTNAVVRLEEAQNEADRTAAELAIKESDHQLRIAEHQMDMISRNFNI